MLMSYGPDFVDVHRRTGGYVARILCGSDPAEMPIQQPTSLEFVINLRTAEALALALPPEIMTLATEIIE